MKRFIVVVGAIAALANMTNATFASDEILRRLDALEKENASLRQRLARVEKSNLTLSAPTPSASYAAAAPLPGIKATAKRGLTARPSFDWTGAYIGGHVGTGLAYSEQTFPPSLPFPFVIDSSHTAHGPLGGGQIGFNWQRGILLVGAEADGSLARLVGKGTCIGGTLNCGVDVQGLGTVAARIGLTSDRLLMFVRGGLAWADTSFSTSVQGRGANSTEQHRFGWSMGSGVEYAFSHRWSAKLQYDYLDFGRRNVTFSFGDIGAVVNGPLTLSADIRHSVHRFTTGINYRFWSEDDAHRP